MSNHDDMIRRLVELSRSIEDIHDDSSGEVATYLRQAADKVLTALGKVSLAQQRAVAS